MCIQSSPIDTIDAAKTEAVFAALPNADSVPLDGTQGIGVEVAAADEATQEVNTTRHAQTESANAFLCRTTSAKRTPEFLAPSRSGRHRLSHGRQLASDANPQQPNACCRRREWSEDEARGANSPRQPVDTTPVVLVGAVPDTRTLLWPITILERTTLPSLETT